MARPAQRTEAALARLQIEALDAWHQARRSVEDAVVASTASREARMDVNRRLQVLREQHRAIVARTELHLERSVHLMACGLPSRAVVVHRNPWFAGKLTQELTAQGVQVLGAFENGAEGIGVVVAEQPDLLVVQDSLPMVSGEAVVRETRRFSPTTLVVAQVAYEDRIAALLDAGARAAYTRRVSPAEVARGLLGFLAEDALVDA